MQPNQIHILKIDFDQQKIRRCIYPINISTSILLTYKYQYFVLWIRSKFYYSLFMVMVAGHSHDDTSYILYSNKEKQTKKPQQLKRNTMCYLDGQGSGTRIFHCIIHTLFFAYRCFYGPPGIDILNNVFLIILMF